MKKILIFLFSCSLLLCSGCGNSKGTASCNHSWVKADCKNPKTCSICGKTEGNKGEHVWVEADCRNPKTCSICGETVGNKREHVWIEANCKAPKTCSICRETEGNKLEHKWVEANCKAPKTCTLCGKTEGSKLNNHIWSSADCINPKRCTVCGNTDGNPKGHSWIDATYDSPRKCTVCGKTDGEALKRPKITINIANSMPQNFHRYSFRNEIIDTVKISEVTSSFKKDYLYEDLYNITLYFTGEKIYDSKSNGQSRSCCIGIKIYDEEGYVVADDSFYTKDLRVGDKFRNEEKIIFDDLPEGNYTVELLNTN